MAIMVSKPRPKQITHYITLDLCKIHHKSAVVKGLGEYPTTMTSKPETIKDMEISRLFG